MFTVGHNDVINAVVADDFDDVNRKFVVLDGDGVFRHAVLDEVVANLAILLVSADKVSVGENAEKFFVLVGDDGGARARLEHGEDSFLHGGFRKDHGQIGVAPHDIGDFGEEILSEIAAGVKFGEVFGLEATFLQKDHREGITEGEHVGGAGGGSKAKGAGFLFDLGAEHDVAVLGEGGFDVSRDRNNGGGPLFDVGEKRGHLRSLAAVAQRDDEVVGGKDTQISMKGILATETHGGGTGAVESGDEFFTDAFGLAHADYDDFILSVEGVV